MNLDENAPNDKIPCKFPCYQGIGSAERSEFIHKLQRIGAMRATAQVPAPARVKKTGQSHSPAKSPVVSTDPVILEQARAAAQAEFDLARVRQALWFTSKRRKT